MQSMTADAQNSDAGTPNLQSLATENFFYFFLRLRKGEIRRTVQALRARHPEETSEQLARRIIDSYTSVSFLGGTLMHLPFLLPGIGQALQLLGFVGGASALTRMHLYLILEIALAYGKDIDDEARVPEMVAVVAATGLAASAPLAFQALDLNPLFALPASGLTAAGVAHLIGETAIQHYSAEIERARSVPVEPPAPPIVEPAVPEFSAPSVPSPVEPPVPEIPQPPAPEFQQSPPPRPSKRRSRPRVANLRTKRPARAT